MRTRRARGVWAVAALACVVALAGGCSGGGGGGSTGTTAPPPLPVLQITTTALPNGLLGAAYSETLKDAGGRAPYTWSAVTLPPGLSLSAGGVLSGTLGTGGIQGFRVQVTDSSSPPQTAGKTLFITVEGVLVFSPVSFPDPNVSQPYIYHIAVSGGFSPFTWSLSSGAASLPPGLSLTTNSNSTATITGVPTEAGTFNFVLNVSEVDAPYQTVQQNFSLTVTKLPVITTSSLPLGVVGKPYQTTLQATAGTPPYTWSVATNDLPAGLTLNAATGVVSGTPTENWNQGVLFTVTDSAVPAQQAYTLITLGVKPALQFTQTTLPDGVISVGYQYMVPILGGIGPYTVQAQGSLPDGVGISGPGSYFPQFQGSPSMAGTFSFTLSVQDSESPPVSIEQAFSIRINTKLVIEGTQPPPTLVGMSYSQQFQATGGVPPYHQWLLFGLVPNGLTIDPNTGLLSGTLTTGGDYMFEVQVSDSASPPQNALFSISRFLVYNNVKVITSSLPTIATNAPVQLTLKASGGTGNYTWSNPSGGLPTGLTMDPTGVISGQTTATGNFTFTAEVNDPGPPAQTIDQPMELTVGSPGRNDTPATATPLSNGTYAASISPIADPSNGTIAPDTDYYKLTANPGAIVTVEITAARLTPPSPLDSVLEFVDANGNRLSLCSSSPLLEDGPYSSPCMNDDIPVPATTDSKLILQVPSGNSGPLTFYAHVLDWRGDARPDMVYTITISGAN